VLTDLPPRLQSCALPAKIILLRQNASGKTGSGFSGKTHGKMKT
jgi:hypothetical protein